MTRVKRGIIAHKKREKLLKYTKGFKWGRKSKERLAKEALLHAWSHSFHGRKLKKRDFRDMASQNRRRGKRARNELRHFYVGPEKEEYPARQKNFSRACRKSSAGL
jgi:ribosomal protein L20